MIIFASRAEERKHILSVADPHADMVFVFGSNLSGVHGSGAAYWAAVKRNFPGHIGVGPAADCYAIPTKDCHIETLPLHVIAAYVRQFIAFAELMEGADMQFKVTRIGCGHAGYKDFEIAPMFKDAPFNCHFDTTWKTWVDREFLSPPSEHYASIVQKRQYWGSI